MIFTSDVYGTFDPSQLEKFHVIVHCSEDGLLELSHQGFVSFVSVPSSASSSMRTLYTYPPPLEILSHPFIEIDSILIFYLFSGQFRTS